MTRVEYYAPSALDSDDVKNDQLQSNKQFFLQTDVEGVYIRLAAGAFKFLDRRSNDNAVKNKFFAIGQVEAGILFTESSMLRARLGYVAVTQGEMSVAGFNATLVAEPTYLGSLSVLTTF